MTVEGSDRGGAKLPVWWLAAMSLAVVWAMGYWLWAEVFAISPTPVESYTEERLAALENSVEVTEDVLLELSTDALAMRNAAKLFVQNCSKCHGAEGEGKIGPNLTDEYWVAGGAPLAIYQSIVEGRTLKGMPAWGRLIGPGKCKQVAAYLLTIRNTQVAGRPPEGVLWTPSGRCPATRCRA
jgi:cytochrome c oxidase cbb3-type subunit 3